MQGGERARDFRRELRGSLVPSRGSEIHHRLLPPHRTDGNTEASSRVCNACVPGGRRSLWNWGGGASGRVCTETPGRGFWKSETHLGSRKGFCADCETLQTSRTFYGH